MTELPTGLRIICALYGAAVLAWCWVHAVRSSPDTTSAPKRLAVALAAMASLTVVFAAVGLAPWLSSGGLSAVLLLSGVCMILLSSGQLAPEPTRAPQDWSDQ